MSNSLDPDQTGHFTGSGLGPNCLQSLLEISTCDPFRYKMDNSTLIVFICMGKAIRIQNQTKPYGHRREKTCLRVFGNNQGADQPAHMGSLIST